MPIITADIVPAKNIEILFVTVFGSDFTFLSSWGLLYTTTFYKIYCIITRSLQQSVSTTTTVDISEL